MTSAPPPSRLHQQWTLPRKPKKHMSYAPLVEKLVKSVVENPDHVAIEEEFEQGARTFYVRVSQEDVGKVIGKSGRVVSAIRLVVSAIAAKNREKAYVRVVTES